MGASFGAGSVKMKGGTNHVRHQGTHDLGVVLGELVAWVYGDGRILGVPCFMNSAIQCLAHSPKLGELALAFGDLLSKLWTPGSTPAAPAIFKRKQADFAPQSALYAAFYLVFRPMTEPSDSVAWIRDEDKLVAYRLPKDNQNSLLVVFMHERVERPCEFERAIPNLKLFGIPLVARLEDLSTGFDLHKLYLKLHSPLLMPAEDACDDYDDVGITTSEDSTMENVLSPTIRTGLDTGTEDDQCSSSDFRFYLKDGLRSTEMKMNDPLPVPKFNDDLEKDSQFSNHYVFYATSNHHGGMGCGHYDAFIDGVELRMPCIRYIIITSESKAVNRMGNTNSYSDVKSDVTHCLSCFLSAVLDSSMVGKGK
ncbi:hypothetical protein POTOM_052659 [Populus tomentosa]|uniref:Uncharacterized protein n=1 Tax=Populus tomentosa TaxID=118781 RepID=A0A8X7Y5N0_POPTO|nr:hypothetical protein POTOM_052659 [Populus tomentosa]